MPKAIEAVFFQSIKGSMTSDDGLSFFLHVEQENAGDIMLGFPHADLSNLVEHAAMQLSHGRDQDGDEVMSAFRCAGFELSRGPAGEPVLVLKVGEAGRLSFLLPRDMPGKLTEVLLKLAH
jgi:hypothetical protein